MKLTLVRSGHPVKMANRIHPQDVMKALAAVREPGSGRDIVALGCVKGVEVGEGRLSVALELPATASASTPAGERLLRAVQTTVEALGGGQVELHVGRPAPASEGDGGAHAHGHAPGSASPPRPSHGEGPGNAAQASPGKSVKLAPGVKTTI